MCAWLGALVVCVGGCTTRVRAPRSPAEPVRVYLLDHGRHPTLVLPTAEGGLAQYAYGDWSWYAEGRTGVLEALRAMLVCNRAALGRREYDTGSLGAVLADEGAVNVYAIVVSRRVVERLREELESVFERNAGTLHQNAVYRLDFVRDERPYSVIHNCNHMMSSWLRKLDCEVYGLSSLCSWKVEGGE